MRGSAPSVCLFVCFSQGLITAVLLARLSQLNRRRRWPDLVFTPQFRPRFRNAALAASGCSDVSYRRHKHRPLTPMMFSSNALACVRRRVDGDVGCIRGLGGEETVSFEEPPDESLMFAAAGSNFLWTLPGIRCPGGAEAPPTSALVLTRALVVAAAMIHPLLRNLTAADWRSPRRRSLHHSAEWLLGRGVLRALHSTERGR